MWGLDIISGNINIGKWREKYIIQLLYLFLF